MTVPNRNPLIAPSLPAEAMKGAGASAGSISGAEHSAEREALRLALSATDAASGHLRRLAILTDDPPPSTVDAADLLDAARELLAQAVES